MDPVCVSVNIGPPTDEKFICELSDSDHTKYPEDLKKRESFLYIGTEVSGALGDILCSFFFCFSILSLDTKANVRHKSKYTTGKDKKKKNTEVEYLVPIRTRASVTHVYMIQFALTDIRTNSISVNAKLVTQGNNAKKVRLTELFRILI